MTKHPFILFGGVGWCGTTSLYFTMRDSRYIHTGWYKETAQLSIIEDYEDWGYINEKKFLNFINYEYPLVTLSVSTFDKTILGPLLKTGSDIKTLEDAVELQSKGGIPSPYCRNSEFKPFLEPYIEYYRNLATAAIDEGPYKAVGDFSNNNIQLSERFLTKLKNTLGLYFDIKPMFMFRDPVRRLFSDFNSLYHYTKKIPSNEHHTASEFYLHYLNTITLEKEKVLNYCTSLERFQRVFGKENVSYFIMEDFFVDGYPEELKKLERITNYTYNMICPCAFVPDKGINAPKIPRLPDQWDSDHEILTEELYAIGREKLSFVYDSFEKMHGFLPADWGKPIDYNY